ncbi:hypothetical protein Q5M53_10410 [Acinetobacter baumannii]|nr:hypothetical protein [Acinetobacter baumannii]
MSQETLYILDARTTAKEMREALASVANILKEHEVITEAGYLSLMDVTQQLRRFKNNSAWQISIERETPVEFELVDKIYKETEPVTIELSSECISVDFEKTFPFINLDICIVIKNLDEEPVSRWHFDLANKKESGMMQSGPLTHVQYGGHNPGFRHLDHALKVPRLNHPPMDIVLLCEVVVSNFFPSKWDLIRENPSWCDAVSTCQRICYSDYFKKIIQTLGCRNTTILHEMDANIWSKSLSA